jgi:hypothetical protein
MPEMIGEILLAPEMLPECPKRPPVPTKIRSEDIRQWELVIYFYAAHSAQAANWRLKGDGRYD